MHHDADTRTPDPDTNALLLGRYAIIGVDERGPTSEMSRAHDVHKQLPVRIRRIYAQQDSEHLDVARLSRERMAHEYRVARLFAETPPGLLRVIEFATEPDGSALLVTEDTPGGTLRERLAEDVLPPDAALAVAAEVGAALAAAHATGVVHRNLKPANIWFGADGRVRVGDFSLAQVRGEHPPGWRHPGTPLYASPEQETTTRPLTPASDQYALGLVLFEMLTGAKYRRLDAARAADLLAGLPTDLHRLMTRMLAPEPGDRFASLDAVVAEIARMRGEVTPETEHGITPGKVSNVAQMSEPVPQETAHPRRPPQPEMEPGQGDLRRLAEPIPGDALPDRHAPAVPAPAPATPGPEPGRIPGVAPLFGPRRGVLQPVAGSVAALHAGVTLRDGVVSARFLNPGDAATAQWSVGFAFREAAGAGYYLCGINARGEWFVTAGRHDAPNDTAPWETGKSGAIQTAEDGINTLSLTLAGDLANLAVNGVALAAVDLAGFAPFVTLPQGDVSITAQCAATGAEGDTSVLFDRWTATATI